MFINNNIKLRNGGRKAPAVSTRYLADKIVECYCEDEYPFINEVDDMDEEDFTDMLYSILCRPYLAQPLSDDIKIAVDFENISSEEENCGFNYTESRIPYYGFIAGGDWEIPVYMIMYWDGKSLRIYIPTKGNLFNAKIKAALGNNEEADKEFLISEGILSEDEDIYDVYNKLEYNFKNIREDIESRLEVR